jgi:nucleotide-binding universal stress UspA family protein
MAYGVHPGFSMHILLGTDGSSHAITAATRALDLLAPTETLTLLAAAPTPAITTQGFESGFAGGIASQVEVDAACEKVKAEMRAALAATVAAMADALRPRIVHERVETGDPGLLLCTLASELNVDVIVLGSRGRGALKRALLGSVSSYVVHHAQRPVLVIPSEA